MIVQKMTQAKERGNPNISGSELAKILYPGQIRKKVRVIMTVTKSNLERK